MTAETLRVALHVQLLERTHFVDAPNPQVAELLMDWARLEMLDGALETAAVLYPAAERYGYPDKAAIRRELAEVERLLESAKRSRS